MPNFDPAQIITALAVFIPALLGALKTFKASGDEDKRFKAVEDRLTEQDKQTAEMKADQQRAFREQGQAREEQKYLLREMRGMLGEARQKLGAIPSRSEFAYRREPGSMEITPLPSVAPKQDPITERHHVPDPDEYPGLDEEFKPKRRRK